MTNWDESTIYVFVRQDLTIEQLAIQALHGMFAMTADLSPRLAGTPKLVTIGMPDIKALNRVINKLVSHGIGFEQYQDQDMPELGVTAVVTVPLSEEDKVPLANYRLWRYSPAVVGEPAGVGALDGDRGANTPT